MNLTALTPCCVDYYPQIDKSFSGGNSLNVASMWKTLEPSANVSVITCLGDDAHGKMILDLLTKKHIDVSRVYRRTGATACNQLRVDEHGERFGIEGTWNGGVYETFRLSDGDWAFVAGQDIVAIPGNNPNFSGMLDKKHDRQLLAVDYLDVLNNAPIRETIHKTDIAFISASPDLLGSYEELAAATNKLLVVTLGAYGSRAFYHGKQYDQPALKVDKVIDTTGCGDAYQAAFSLTYYKCRDIRQSMAAGARAAARILQAWGGAGSGG